MDADIKYRRRLPSADAILQMTADIRSAFQTSSWGSVRVRL